MLSEVCPQVVLVSPSGLAECPDGEADVHFWPRPKRARKGARRRKSESKAASTNPSLAPIAGELGSSSEQQHGSGGDAGAGDDDEARDDEEDFHGLADDDNDQANEDIDFVGELFDVLVEAGEFPGDDTRHGEPAEGVGVQCDPAEVVGGRAECDEGDDPFGGDYFGSCASQPADPSRHGPFNDDEGETCMASARGVGSGTGLAHEAVPPPPQPQGQLVATSRRKKQRLWDMAEPHNICFC